MNQVETKCPVCGKWSSGTGKIGARCPHCDAQFDPMRVQYAEAKRLNAEMTVKDSYLIIKDSDDTIVQMSKEFINFIRWTTFYGISIVYFFIAAMIIIFGLVML